MIEQVFDKEGNVFAAQSTAVEQELDPVYGLDGVARIVVRNRHRMIRADGVALSKVVHYRMVCDDGRVICERVGHVGGERFESYKAYGVAALPILSCEDVLAEVQSLARGNWEVAADRILDAALGGRRQKDLATDVVHEYAAKIAALGYRVIIVNKDRDGYSEAVVDHPFVRERGEIVYVAEDPNHILGSGEFVLDAGTAKDMWAAHVKALREARADYAKNHS